MWKYFLASAFIFSLTSPVYAGEQTVANPFSNNVTFQDSHNVSIPAETRSPVISNSPVTSVITNPESSTGCNKVWVNMKSHIYHVKGTKYYGTTRDGKFMCENEAIAEHDRKAKR